MDKEPAASKTPNGLPVSRAPKRQTGGIPGHIENYFPCDPQESHFIPMEDFARQIFALDCDFRPEALLLQGPVGPFHDELRAVLAARGHSCLSVTFSPADRIYSRESESCRTLSYAGGKASWPDALELLLDRFPIRIVVLFGNRRPAHKAAARLAQARGATILSLEEGYIRPGFVTAEIFGNNAESPLAGTIPPNPPDPLPAAIATPVSNFLPMARFAGLHYVTRNLLATPREREMFHRRYRLVHEAVSWAVAAASCATRLRGERRKAERIIRRHAGRYCFVALQVPTDSNLLGPAGGWTSRRLIRVLCTHLPSHPDPDFRLVVKLHPMARDRWSIRNFVRRAARENGVADRVDILEFGPTERLADAAASMATINSSSGLFALKHGTPLLALGKSFYTAPDLVRTASSEEEIGRFLRTPGQVRPMPEIEHWIRQRALLPGDFYAADGRRIAVEALLRRIEHEIAAQDASKTRISRT